MAGGAASDDVGAAFRSAMRRLASTVTILTTHRLGQRSGMTATAVTSLSVEPPALLACVNRSASIHPDLSDGARFCVNILGSMHVGLSTAFGGQADPEVRFDHGVWQHDAFDVPYLADAPANVFCVVAQMIEYGTHSVVIGRVYAALAQPMAAPLLYGDGRYLSPSEL